jgi:hypothetical protein
MHNFKQFIESQEEDDKPVRIKIGPWPSNPDSPQSTLKIKPKDNQSISPNEFIALFNKEVNAKNYDRNIKYYIDGDSLVSYSIKPAFGQVYVSDLQVQPRGLPAIKFLLKLTKLADQYNITLTCFSKPLDVDDKVNPQRLTNLYKKFGFKNKSTNSDELVRLPKPTQV